MGLSTTTYAIAIHIYEYLDLADQVCYIWELVVSEHIAIIVISSRNVSIHH